jgi:adenylate cyclase, class 2
MQTAPAESYLDVNVKARCRHPEKIQSILEEKGASFLGEDFQVDTFYEVEEGKMKLREGTIENLITHYLREEIEGEWRTRVFVYELFPAEAKKEQLLGHLHELGQVKKWRKIFFIDNVKFHLDRFENGECFVEIEAMDRTGQLGVMHIRQQAEEYKQLLSIHETDILTTSYIDLYEQ